MIKYPHKFEQSPSANFDGLFDWDFLLPAFCGTNIQPTDIDACIERNGKFLLFETKDSTKSLEKGQMIMFEKLIILGKGSIFLFILYGKTQIEIKHIEIWSFASSLIGFIKKTSVDCDWNYVLEKTKSWFNWANSI